MSVVVVAGGLGDMGRLITEALYETGKHEVYIMTRKIPPQCENTRVSPLSSKAYSPLIQTDYTSEKNIAELLRQRNVDTVICTFAMDFESASNAQLRLIRAADAASCVKRFIPSEFNVDYDLSDAILPYPSKHLHTVARRELEKTRLEYTYIYCGMFMDYFGLPNIPGYTRALYIMMDPANRVAYVPGNGDAFISVSFTKDVAYYSARALELQSWPRVMTVVANTLTCNELVSLTEIHLGASLNIVHQSIDSLLQRKNSVLPGNISLAKHFPEGLDQVKALTADLEASIALGAYNLTNIGENLDLVTRFCDGSTPTRIEQFLARAWGKN